MVEGESLQKIERSRKIYLTIPWFGEASGGAEVYCQGLALALQGAGFAVEILTTCCKDPFADWAESFHPAGLAQVEVAAEAGSGGGSSHSRTLAVRRFAPNGRDGRRYVELELKLRDGRTLSAAEEREWLRNSINSDALCEFAGKNREEGQFIFLPYLYGLTFFGCAAAGGRGWLIPCLHNEGAAYLRVFDEMFRGAAGCLFLSEAEMEFGRARFGLAREKCRLIRGGIGNGVAGDVRSFRAKYDLAGDYLLYVGRLVPGKGADWLIECYQYALEQLGGVLPPLVLIGAGELPKGAGANIRALGRLSDAEVDAALQGCLALCQPSFYESFSIVLLNGWRHGRPALVNARCDVLRRHCAASNGGVWFGDGREFTECVRWLCEQRAGAERMGRAGREYVRRDFDWGWTVGRLTVSSG